MGTYRRFYKMAERLLGGGNLGRPITIEREGESTYNYDTGEVVSNITTIPAIGVRVAFKQYLVDGTNIQNEDTQIYIFSEDRNQCSLDYIHPQDVIEMHGERFTVVGVSPWKFESYPIGFKVHARLTD